MKKFQIGFALLILTLTVATVARTDVNQEGNSRIKGADLDLLGAVREIAGRVEQFLNEKFDRRPIAVRVTEPMREVAATIRAQSVLSFARTEARGRAWVDLGLGGPNSPRRLLDVLAADLKGIGFDPQGNRLLIAPDRLTGEDFEPHEGDDKSSTVLLMTGVRFDEPLVGHFLTHVRQIERYGRDSMDESTDQMLARMAWAEGEANLLAIRYLFDGMGLADEILDTHFDPGAVLDGMLLPPEIETLDGPEGEFLRFVYLEGFTQAVSEYKRGGWPQLKRAMSERTLTRGLLHQGGGSGPTVTFEAPRPPLDRFELADEDSLGEQGIVVLVSRLTGKDNLGLMVGDGWTADRVYRWEKDGDSSEGITEWKTRWNTVEAAKDFEYAFERCLAARFPRVERSKGEGRISLTADGRVYRIDRRDKTVNIRIASESADARIESRGAAG